jgi:hypothetical protein
MRERSMKRSPGRTRYATESIVIHPSGTAFHFHAATSGESRCFGRPMWACLALGGSSFNWTAAKAGPMNRTPSTFGGGTGYAFLGQDENEGRFYWDRVVRGATLAPPPTHPDDKTPADQDSSR